MRNKRKQSYNTKWTRDHLISREKGGTGCEENIHRKKRSVHSGKHEYLGNKLFHNQLLSIIEENKTTLQPEALQVMEEFKEAIKMLMDNESMYKKKCFSYGKYPKI